MSNKCELIKAPSFALLACSETLKRKKKNTICLLKIYFWHFGFPVWSVVCVRLLAGCIITSSKDLTEWLVARLLL